MGSAFVKRFFDKSIDIVDPADGGDCKIAEMRTYKKRLRFAVGDAPDTDISFHFIEVAFKFRTKR